MPTPQEDFDDTYVTSAEICLDLGVSKVSIHNMRVAGRLPGAIEIKTRGGGLHCLLWRRAEIAPHLEVWRQRLAKRRRAA